MTTTSLISLIVPRRTMGKVHKAKRTVKLANKRIATRPVPRTGKAVRFAESEEVAYRHLTQEELQKAWYQSAEFAAFKSDCIHTARQYREVQGDVTRLDPAKVCLRGLEQHLTRTSTMTRRMNITSSIRMVLHEQLSQKSLRISKPERVRDVSRVLSEAARKRAITVADFDAKLCRL